MTATASAQDYGQTATLKIWDNTTAPHSNGITTPETEKEPNRVRNTSEATLYIFPADKAKATGQAVVICPGGGYGMLAMDHSAGSYVYDTAGRLRVYNRYGSGAQALASDVKALLGEAG